MVTYPIILLPDQMLESIESEITDQEIFEHMNLKYPVLDLRIHIKYNENISKSGKEKDNKIAELKRRFPHAKLVDNDYFFETYEICYPVSDAKYFNSSYTFAKAFIGTFDVPHPPKKTKTETIERKENGCLVGIIIMATILLCLTFTLNFNAFVFLGVTTILFFLFFSKSLLKTVEDKIEVPKDDATYKKDYNAFTLSIEDSRKFVRKRFENETIIAKKIADENRIKVEREIYLRKVLPTINFKKVNSNENRGKSEIYFLEKLHETFRNQILVDIYPMVGKNPFQPDFVLRCEETGFCINIEIDEPYSARNGKPIHHDRSDDEKRNAFFLELNIIVVRFSEKQVVQNAKQCCKFIEQIVQSIRNKKLPSFKHEIPNDKKWTYEEALIFANNNYRNSYLPDQMKVKTVMKKYGEKENDFYDDLPF